jgi:predicted RND superfamily exporter protein
MSQMRRLRQNREANRTGSQANRIASPSPRKKRVAVIESLISLVVLIVVLALIYFFLQWVFVQLSVPAVIQKIVLVICALFAFLALLGILGYGPGAGKFR